MEEAETLLAEEQFRSGGSEIIGQSEEGFVGRKKEEREEAMPMMEEEEEERQCHALSFFQLINGDVARSVLSPFHSVRGRKEYAAFFHARGHSGTLGYSLFFKKIYFYNAQRRTSNFQFIIFLEDLPSFFPFC